MLDLLYNLERRMGRVVTPPFGGFDWVPGEVATGAWVPVVDIFEEPEGLRIVAEIPGVSGPTAPSSAASPCRRRWIRRRSGPPTRTGC